MSRDPVNSGARLWIIYYLINIYKMLYRFFSFSFWLYFNTGSWLYCYVYMVIGNFKIEFRVFKYFCQASPNFKQSTEFNSVTRRAYSGQLICQNSKKCQNYNNLLKTYFFSTLKALGIIIWTQIAGKWYEKWLYNKSLNDIFNTTIIIGTYYLHSF